LFGTGVAGRLDRWFGAARFARFERMVERAAHPD